MKYIFLWSAFEPDIYIYIILFRNNQIYNLNMNFKTYLKALAKSYRKGIWYSKEGRGY